jgi:hypothetical protein
MTQYPNYQQPYPPMNPNPRPTSVLVLAIIGIIFGAFGTLCSPLALLPYVMNFNVPGAPPNPAFDTINNSPFLHSYMIVSVVVGWFMAILLLVCSIAALSLKPWARKGLLAWAGITIVTGIIGLFITVAFILPAMGQGNTPQAKGAAIGGMVGGIVGGVISLILPVLMLVFMTRPHVVAAFEQNDPANIPQPPQPPYPQ